MQEKVARLRQLMREAIPVSQPSREEVAAAAFELHTLNSCPTPVVESTPRARQEREVMRIATWYNWTGEVVRFIDRAGGSRIDDLDQADLDALTQRMHQLEQCAQNGLDAPDCPVAR